MCHGKDINSLLVWATPALYASKFYITSKLKLKPSDFNHILKIFSRHFEKRENSHRQYNIMNKFSQQNFKMF